MTGQPGRAARRVPGQQGPCRSCRAEPVSTPRAMWTTPPSTPPSRRPRFVVSQRMVNQRLAPTSIEPRGGRGALRAWTGPHDDLVVDAEPPHPAYLRGLDDRARRGSGSGRGAGGRRWLRVEDQHLRGGEYVAAAVLQAARGGRSSGWRSDPRRSSPRCTAGASSATSTSRPRRDGTVLGLKLRLIADIGAYNMFLTAAIPTLTMTMANATYAIPAIRVTLTEVFTNKTPHRRVSGGPDAPRRRISWNGPWTCSRVSCRWTRRRCDARTSSHPISSRTRPRWARSTIRATTRRRSTTRCKWRIGGAEGRA